MGQHHVFDEKKGGGDGKERQAIDMLSLIMMYLFSLRDTKSVHHSPAMSYSCQHAQVVDKKKKRKVSMLGKMYLLTQCHKTFTFLSYLSPEEAEIPLLDTNNLYG